MTYPRLTGGPTVSPTDPDPFEEVPLDDAERARLLRQLAEHAQPLIAKLSKEERESAEVLWDDLRTQATVSSFQSAAAAFLDALEQAGQNSGGEGSDDALVDADAPSAVGAESSDRPPAPLGGPKPSVASADKGGSGVSAPVIGGIAAAVLLVGGVAVFAISQSGDDSGAAAGDSGAAAEAASTYTPPAGLTRELRDAGLSPAKFKAACEEQDYDKLRWFDRRIDAQITCAYHAGIDLDTGLPADPPGPKYTVSAANREKLKSEFGMVPSDLRPTCLQIAREFRESRLRGKKDGDTYWEIADKHHSSSIRSYSEGKYSGSRLDPCLRFAGVDPWFGAAPYFVANGRADNDTEGLTYTYI